jgi:hypothetical protein
MTGKARSKVDTLKMVLDDYPVVSPSLFKQMGSTTPTLSSHLHLHPNSSLPRPSPTAIPGTLTPLALSSSVLAKVQTCNPSCTYPQSLK